MLRNDLPERTIVLADRAYDADGIREVIQDQDCTGYIPQETKRADDFLYRRRQYPRASQAIAL